MSITLDNQELGNIFKEVSQPFQEFGSLISIIAHGATDLLVPALMELFDLKQGEKDFILNQYLPEVMYLEL